MYYQEEKAHEKVVGSARFRKLKLQKHYLTGEMALMVRRNLTRYQTRWKNLGICPSLKVWREKQRTKFCFDHSLFNPSRCVHCFRSNHSRPECEHSHILSSHTLLYTPHELLALTLPGQTRCLMMGTAVCTFTPVLVNEGHNDVVWGHLFDIEDANLRRRRSR